MISDLFHLNADFVNKRPLCGPLMGEDLGQGNVQLLAPDPHFADDADFSIGSMQPHVVNIVASVPFELSDSGTQERNADYNPQHFQAVIFRTEEPCATAIRLELCPEEVVEEKLGDKLLIGAKLFHS
jgi:hypothetical protein